VCVSLCVCVCVCLSVYVRARARVCARVQVCTAHAHMHRHMQTEDMAARDGQAPQRMRSNGGGWGARGGGGLRGWPTVTPPDHALPVQAA
jgi:hypothetical protein